jgi:hypothetical protein
VQTLLWQELRADPLRNRKQLTTELVALRISINRCLPLDDRRVMASL